MKAVVDIEGWTLMILPGKHFAPLWPSPTLVGKVIRMG